MLGNNNVGGMGSSGSFMSSARADNIINQKDKKLKSFSIENKELKGTVSDLKKRNEILENERKNNNRNQCDLQKVNISKHPDFKKVVGREARNMARKMSNDKIPCWGCKLNDKK